MTTPIELWFFVLLIGTTAGVYMLGTLLWSIKQQENRTWPPDQTTTAISFRVWFMTRNVRFVLKADLRCGARGSIGAVAKLKVSFADKADIWFLKCGNRF